MHKWSTKIIALALGAVFMLFPLTGAAAEFELTLAHSGEPNHPWHPAAQKFIKQVEEQTNGRVKFKSLFVLGEFGGEREMAEALQNGTLDMIIIATMGMSAFESQLLLFDFPYLFPSFEKAFEVLDGPVGKLMADKLERKGFHVLAYFDHDFRGLTNSKRPIQTLEDIAGLKLRTPESPVLVAWLKQLGASPTPMPSTELYSALQTGVVDGQDNGIIFSYTHRVTEVQKYYTATNHIYCPSPLFINADLWKSMPKDIREIIEKAAADARDYQRQLSAKYRIDYQDAMRKQGVTVTKLDDKEYARFIESGRSVYGQFKDRIDKELYDAMMQAIQ